MSQVEQAKQAQTPANGRPDGHDPDDLLVRLSKLGPVDLAEAQAKYQPAKEDALIQTLEHRARVQAADAKATTEAGVRTTLPVQTITAVLQSLQAGESKDLVMKTYQIGPDVFEKLTALSIPVMTVGRRR